MTALVGVIATAFCLVLFILFCVAYTFKTRKCCFKHKGPAFERDNNFRIYPNDNYIVSRHLITMVRVHSKFKKLSYQFAHWLKVIPWWDNKSLKVIASYDQNWGSTGSQKFSKSTNKVKNLTTSNFFEIEIFLYKSRSLNMKQKELHQYLS